MSGAGRCQAAAGFQLLGSSSFKVAVVTVSIFRNTCSIHFTGSGPLRFLCGTRRRWVEARAEGRPWFGVRRMSAGPFAGCCPILADSRSRCRSQGRRGGPPGWVRSGGWENGFRIFTPVDSTSATLRVTNVSW